jgi:hypothetical protein
MSCRELESLFLSDAGPSDVAAHRSRCAECDALARDIDAAAGMTSALRPPPWSRELRLALLEIPSRTLSCEQADDAIAELLEGQLSTGRRARLDFHLARCAGCAEAAGTLASARELVAPRPSPWLAGKVLASRPRPARKSPWAWLFSPRGAIAVAYSAAVLVILLGFNPADVTRGGGRLKQETRAAVQVAGSSIADRLGAMGEKAARAVAIFRGRFGGYGRAALSNALNLVMRPENPRPSNRPRSGDDKGAPEKTQTELTTWRA